MLNPKLNSKQYATMLSLVSTIGLAMCQPRLADMTPDLYHLHPPRKLFQMISTVGGAMTAEIGSCPTQKAGDMNQSTGDAFKCKEAYYHHSLRMRKGAMKC